VLGQIDIFILHKQQPLCRLIFFGFVGGHRHMAVTKEENYSPQFFALAWVALGNVALAHGTDNA
jgi:hypothetical protein